jgi:hypothetical protein
VAEALRDQARAGAGQALIASVTRLRLRAWRLVPAFLYRAFRSQRQAERSDGFLGGYVAMAPRRAFWTVTLWRDAEAMHAYRRAGAHLAAMPKLLDWCDEAAVATLADVEALPEPEEAARRLAAEGRLSKVRHPSEAHAGGAVCPDGAVPRATQRLKPRGR